MAGCASTGCDVSLMEGHDKGRSQCVADEIIQKVYDDMMVFDRALAEDVIDLIVRRNSAARNAFGVLFKDMQELQRTGF